MPSADIEINLISYSDGTVEIEVYTDFGRAVSVQLNHPSGTHQQVIPDKVRSSIGGRLPLPKPEPGTAAAYEAWRRANEARSVYTEVAPVIFSRPIRRAAFFPVPRPSTGKVEGHISKASRIEFLENLVADLPTYADLNLILRTLNTVIEVVNRLGVNEVDPIVRVARETRGR